MLPYAWTQFARAYEPVEGRSAIFLPASLEIDPTSRGWRSGLLAASSTRNLARTRIAAAALLTDFRPLPRHRHA